jgi:hypothetical protein
VAVEAVEDHQEGPPDLAREEEEGRTKTSPLLRLVEVEVEAAGMGWSSSRLEVTGGREKGVGIEEIIIEIGGMTDGMMTEEARSAIVIAIDTTETEGGRGREVRVIGIEAGTIGIEIGTGIEIEKGAMEEEAEAGTGNTVIGDSIVVWGSKS